MAKRYGFKLLLVYSPISHISRLTYHNFSITVAVAQHSVKENVGLTVESNRTNQFGSIFRRESNRIESKLFFANLNAIGSDIEYSPTTGYGPIL